MGFSRLPLHQPASPGARGPASAVGSGVSGQKGRNRTTGGRTGRRRVAKSGDVRGRTGDIAHLEREQYFAFCSPCQALSFSFISPPSLFRRNPLELSLRLAAALCSNLDDANFETNFARAVAMPGGVATAASHLTLWRTAGPLENHWGIRAHRILPTQPACLGTFLHRGASPNSRSETRS